MGRMANHGEYKAAIQFYVQTLNISGPKFKIDGGRLYGNIF